MTCIVGLIHSGEMWIGGDGAVVGYNNKTSVTNPKVFKRHNYLIGSAGQLRAMDLLRIARLPKYDGKDIHDWAVAHFVPAVAESFRENEYKKPDVSILLMVGGAILDLDSKLAVTGPYVGAYGAVGSGAEYALGSILETSRYSPKARVRKALEAAAYFVPGEVSEPFTILSAKI